MAYALGIGIGTQNRNGEWLETFYARPHLHPEAALLAAVKRVVPAAENTSTVMLNADELRALSEALSAAGAEQDAAIATALIDSSGPTVLCVLQENAAPQTTPEAYLKLHLLSHRLCRPHEVVLDGIFAVLPNVAWTNEGAIDLGELTSRQLAARAAGRALSVDSIDKFPKMTDYVVPSGIRIADTARVRLGAYLGEGTTVMHEGFINFNAGTEGPGMIEGRISAGVFVGAGSDLGGGCSTMGTLSGGNKTIISVGKECLIGANAGIGIPLGDRCTIEAGLYLTAGSKVTVRDNEGNTVEVTRARDLAGQDDLLFRRNSQTGAIEALSNRSAIELNHALHAHN